MLVQLCNFHHIPQYSNSFCTLPKIQILLPDYLFLINISISETFTYDNSISVLSQRLECTFIVV